MPFQCGQCNQWHPSPKPAPECTCKSDPKTCRACEADAEFRASKAQVGWAS